MKICFILTEIANGGAERVVLNLCQYYLSCADELSLIALKKIDENNSIYQEFKLLNLPIYSLNMSKFSFFSFSKLNSIVNEIKPDVIHSHLFHGNILSRFIKRSPNKFRLVNTIHIMEYRKSAFWRFWLDRITFNRCEVHTSVALSTAEFHAKKLHVPADRFKIIPNGINLPRKLTDSELANFSNAFNLNKFDRILGSVGRLNHQKGFDRLIELLPAIEKVIPDGEKWAYLLIGDGTEKEKLENLSSKYHSDKIEVIFAGFHAEANSLIALFDCFVIPSRSEGYPLVLLEAMSHGVPMVVNNVSCIVEALGDYPNGEVIDFFHDVPSEIADKIKKSAQKNKIQYSNITSVAEMAENYKKSAYL